MMSCCDNSSYDEFEKTYKTVCKRVVKAFEKRTLTGLTEPIGENTADEVQKFLEDSGVIWFMNERMRYLEEIVNRIPKIIPFCPNAQEALYQKIVRTIISGKESYLECDFDYHGNIKYHIDGGYMMIALQDAGILELIRKF